MLIRTSHLQQLPPQITPSGLVFWQGSVKMQSVLTLPNASPHWQPLRVGLSKHPRLGLKRQKSRKRAHENKQWKSENPSGEFALVRWNLFSREVKPFFSWAQTFFLVRTNSTSQLLRLRFCLDFAPLPDFRLRKIDLFVDKRLCFHDIFLILSEHTSSWPSASLVSQLLACKKVVNDNNLCKL